MMHITQYRVFSAIQSLDQAGAELAQVETFRIFNSALKPMTLHQAYQAKLSTLVELPQVDRCFHLVNPKMTLAGAESERGGPRPRNRAERRAEATQGSVGRKYAFMNAASNGERPEPYRLHARDDRHGPRREARVIKM